VAQTAVATQIHEPFDVHGNLSAQFALYFKLTVNDFANTVYFSVR
jgi:hypothetical protein